MTTDLMCARCGLKVEPFRGRFRHLANGSTGKSCGKEPDVVSRSEYEAEAAAIVAAVKSGEIRI